MMKRIFSLPLLTIILISTLILSSCGEGTGLSSSADAPSGSLLFEDDFSQTRNGWGEADWAGGKIESKYGGMLFQVYLPNFMFWSVNGKSYKDAQIEVDAILVEGPSNDNFGIICRYQDEENFYSFLVSHDGYYGIFKYLDGKMVSASVDGNMAFSEAIHTEGEVNHIRAVCQDNILSLSVNDVLLASVSDDSFQEGKSGLIVGAYDEPGVVVLFDNFKVTQP